jgi:hypothetical protein
MTPAEVVGLSVPVLLNMTRTLQAAKPWWGAVLPPKYQWIPSVVIAATVELVAKLNTGVSSWMDIVLPLIVVSALFAPGARSAAHASVAAVAKREAFGDPHAEQKIALAEGSIRPPKLQDEPPSTKRPPTLPMLMMVVAFCFGLGSCSNWKPAARTANDLARDMCSLFFSEAQGISFEDAARTACDTHEKVKPFLDELLRAQEVAGAKAGLKK